MNKKKVLICDDDQDFSRILILRLVKDYEVQVAVDGTQVMGLARHWKPDCIVLDVNMPAGDAYHTLRLLEQNTQTLAIPVILMSGKDPDFTQINEIHQKNFMKKPFEAVRLVEKIENLTSDSQRPSDQKRENPSQSTDEKSAGD